MVSHSLESLPAKYLLSQMDKPSTASSHQQLRISAAFYASYQMNCFHEFCYKV